jgi:hypothetical protein
MNQKIEFKSDKSIEELKRATTTYFTEQGFKLEIDDEKFLQFKRGNTLKNMVTFNPLKWKSVTQISFEEKKVIANFEINTIYQAVTFKEEKMWENFISNYQKTIETGKSFISENKKQLKETKKSQWIYVGYALLGAIVFGIPGGILTYFTGIESFTTMGAIGGSMYFMLNKINNEKDKNAT